MEKLSDQIGQKIRMLRNEQKLTQEQLAEKAEISYTFLGDIERGRRSCTISTLERIVEALGSDLTTFFKPDTDDTLKKTDLYVRLLKQIPEGYDETVTETLKALAKMPKRNK